MSVGSRIRDIRKQRGLTLEEVAIRIGGDQGALSKVERDKQGYTDALLDKLAEAFGVRKADFFLEDSNVEELATPERLRRVPIVGYGYNGPFSETTDAYPVGEGSEVILTDIDVGPNAFGLRIKGDSNFPEFKEGDKVIIDPAVKPMPGDMVFAKNGHEEGTFKKYRPRGTDEQGNDVFELVPINDDYPTLHSLRDGPFHIVGTMVEHRRFRRR